MFGNWRREAPRYEREEELPIVILRLLSEEMATALDLARRLAERQGTSFDGSASVVYPQLQYLEDRGFVTIEPVGDRKVYAVSEAGFAHLAAHSEGGSARAQRPHDDAEDFFRERGGLFGRPHHGPDDEQRGGSHGCRGRQDWGGPRGWHHGWRHDWHHGWHHQGWHHHGDFHRGDVMQLVWELKGLAKSFKRALRHGQLDRARLDKLHAILRRARAEMEAVLHGEQSAAGF